MGVRKDRAERANGWERSSVDRDKREWIGWNEGVYKGVRERIGRKERMGGRESVDGEVKLKGSG